MGTSAQPLLIFHVVGLVFPAQIALIDANPHGWMTFTYHLTRRRTTIAKLAPTKPLTKTELLANIAATTALPKPQVDAVLTALGGEIQKSLSNKGAGRTRSPAW